ncbi:hypothetical protein [Streptacidiphilus melanogenes]|uniref:hypothetical protein n=1 Tax=Streptacidiphilus melanogenes TaxID=411235 RepID=UPI00159C7789|nr:hypothetical protein [Streptacidiphilus melanogenes]
MSLSPAPPGRPARPGPSLRRVLLIGVVVGLLVLAVEAACSSTAGRNAADCSPAATPTGGAAHCRSGGDSLPGGSTSPGASSSPTPGASASASGSSSGSPKPSGSASGTSGTGPQGTALPAGGCASPTACGFPDASSTGPRITLTPHHLPGATTDITTNGTVIRGWDITGSLDVYADDVTVVDSRITSSNWWGVNLRPGHHGLRVLHSTITGVPGKGPDNGGEDYAVSNMGTSSVEVGWSDISVFGNALSMGQGYLHDNYVHDIRPFVNAGGEWQHADAVISDGGGAGALVIRNNTLLNPVGITQGASASIGLYADSATVHNTVVEHNWLAGGAYALYGGGAGATGITVADNLFSTQYHPSCGAYGTATAWNGAGSGNQWSGNRLSDGTPVPPPSS